MNETTRLENLESELRSYKPEVSELRLKVSHHFAETVRITVILLTTLRLMQPHIQTRLGLAVQNWILIQKNPNTSLSQRDSESDRLQKTIQDILHLPSHQASKVIQELATTYGIPPF